MFKPDLRFINFLLIFCASFSCLLYYVSMHFPKHDACLEQCICTCAVKYISFVTVFHSPALSLSLSYTHTHTHTLSLFLCLSISLFRKDFKVLGFITLIASKHFCLCPHFFFCFCCCSLLIKDLCSLFSYTCLHMCKSLEFPPFAILGSIFLEREA